MTRLSSKSFRATAWLAAILAAAGARGEEHGTAGGHAAGDLKAVLNHPDPDLAAYYQSAAPEIQRLRDVAVDVSKGDADRLNALKELRAKYPDPAVAVAAELVKDAKSDLASLAVTILSGAAAMSDHRMDSANHAAPGLGYMMSLHETAKRGLRSAVDDPRGAICEPAAEILASLSDDKGLEKIAEAAQSGRLAVARAVDLYGLAAKEASGKYLSKYLNGEASADVQSKVVTYLSSVPQFRDKIRDSYLLNAAAPLEARIAAAEGLGGDPSMTLPLLIGRDAPPRVLGAALKEYVEKQAKTLSKTEIDAILNGIRSYPHANDAPATFQHLNDRLQRLRQEHDF